jgi:hypothetical protein
MNKKIVMGIAGVVIFIFAVMIGYKSLEGLDQLDLSDPFEVELDDE